jgi:hypothetical protein
MRYMEIATNQAGNPSRSARPPAISPQSSINSYARRLVEDAAQIRVPELLTTPHAEGLYQVLDRNGVGVVALRTSSLSEAQLTRLLSYRLAQYLLADLVDPEVVYRDRLRHDLLSSVSSGDIHLIAGVPGTGQILCYMVLRAVQADATTLRSRRRPLFPVEQAFGRGIYNNLPTLPDLPITSILELSRFVKNQQIGVRDEGILRSPVEIAAAMLRVVFDRRQGVSALVGDVEEGVSRYFGFFHMPTLVLSNATPITPEEGFLGWAAQSRHFLPFAILLADYARHHERLESIERSLALPGLHGVRALLALKHSAQMPSSSLEVVLPPQPQETPVMSFGCRCSPTTTCPTCQLSQLAYAGVRELYGGRPLLA